MLQEEYACVSYNDPIIELLTKGLNLYMAKVTSFLYQLGDEKHLPLQLSVVTDTITHRLVIVFPPSKEAIIQLGLFNTILDFGSQVASAWCCSLPSEYRCHQQLHIKSDQKKKTYSKYL